ncbi:MAG TPA: M20/M25/M40 family metallo-hydrolase [Ktedonobacterales bacterium]|nr:M20/M25/M40 family metallo-hydrolase [Ktedonobacterales bacterium]
MASEWYNDVRRFTERLVRMNSVSPGAGEIVVAREILALLTEDGYGANYTASGLDPIEGDRYERANVYAFVQGASPRTVVLLGHFDTVGTGDYGPLEPWARQPGELWAHREALAAMTPGLAEDLAAHPDDWMLGRGTIDMKSGVAANIAIIRHLAARNKQPLPLSVVFLATPDEENESAGVLHAARFLLRLRAERGLDYLGAINTDYTAARYTGDNHRYIYTGTVGKLLPSFLVIGRESHVGEPFSGVDANLLAAEMISDLSMNPDLCDHVRGQSTPPPVTLHATDLKARYDVQLPFAAYFYLNVLTLDATPDRLIETLRQRATAALARTLAHIDTAERDWIAGQANTSWQPRATPRTGDVLTWRELWAASIERLGEDTVAAALDDAWMRLPEEIDSRERSMRLAHALWTVSGREGPAIVIYYSPPYYPHIAAAPCLLHEAVAQVAASHPDVHLSVEEFYPFISDMSYLQLDTTADLAALTANMPVWRADGAPARMGDYTLPLADIAALGLPVVNFGPYGAGAHQRGERLLMSYSFETLPQLLLETIERLGARTAG